MFETGDRRLPPAVTVYNPLILGSNNETTVEVTRPFAL